MKSLVAAILLLLVAGCGVSLGPSSETPTVVFYEIRLMGEAKPAPVRRIGESVVLRPFTQSETLDRDGVHYRTSDVAGGYWTYHRWAMAVEAMVRGVAGRDLERSGAFDRALLLDNGGRAEYVIDARVLRFEEIDEDDGWFGAVEILFEVTRGSDGELVLHERFRAREKADAENVPEVVRALGRATRKVLDKFYEALGRAVEGGGVEEGGGE